MSRIIMLIPTGTSVGLTSVSLGVIRAMERKGVRLSVFKPIAQPRTGGDAPDQTTTIVRANSSTTTAAEPLKMSYVEGLLSSNQKDVLMEEIIANYHANTKDAEVVLVEGLVPTRKHQFAQSLNYEIAKTLNAEIVFVMSQGTDTPEQLKERIELTRNSFGGAKNTNITGVIVNKLNAPVDEQGRTRPDLSEIFDDSTKAKVNNVDPAKLQESSPLPVLGAVPWSFDLIATRAIDMARHLNATIINEGDINTRRVKSVTFCARSIPHMLEHFRAGSLLVTSADRPDVLVAACLAAMNGVEIGALLLTGGYEMDARISKLCERAFATGLPVFMVNTNTWQTSLSLQSFNLEVPVDDHERIEKVQEYVANYINADWIDSLTATSERSRRLSPPAFRYQLTELARKAGKRIVLPEGDEPRVAMLSYSTGTSGAGSDVEKVREATRLAQEKRPDLMIDGPLQYDAAVMADVAKSKAPNSPVAGRATVFIFPDLNTGNTTYKAVQRSADLISIGPMLQGMRKPVNDLSRGALVDDIVYTIALTAIQSAQQQ